MADFKVVLPTTTEEWQGDMKIVYNRALEDLIKEICTGCAYLKGLECANQYGCPCLISQKEVAKAARKLKK